MHRLLIDAAGILGTGIHVKGLATVVLGEKLFDLPIIDLRANTEFEVFLRDGVPELRTHQHISSQSQR